MLEFKDLRNESGLEFIDISSEEKRIYHFLFDNGQNVDVEISKPIALNVSKSGGHRILDGNGVCHYVNQRTKEFISWKTYDDLPHFVK